MRDLCICTGPHFQKDPIPGLVLGRCPLQLLRILSLNLYFISEVLRNNRAMCVSTTFTSSIHDAPRTQNSDEPTLSGGSARLKGGPSSLCFIYDWVSRGMHSPSRLHFLFEPELSLSEGRHRHSKKYKWARSPIISSLVHVTSWSWPTTYTVDNNVEGKAKLEQHLAPFPFWPSFLGKELKVECMLISCNIFLVLVGMK